MAENQEEKKPFGVLLSRSANRCEQSAYNLEQHNIPSHILSLSAPILTDNKIPDHVFRDEHCNLVFTSPTSVEMFELYIKQNSIAAILNRLSAWCVGDKTAGIAKNLGFGRVVSAKGEAKDLAILINNAKDLGSPNFVYLAPKHKSTDLAALVTNPQISLTTTTVYENCFIDCDQNTLALALEKFDKTALFIYSRRSGEHFFSLVQRFGLEDHLKKMIFVSISKKAAFSVPGNLKNKIHLANKPDEPCMIEIAQQQMQL